MTKTLTPREVFDRMCAHWTANEAPAADLLAEDVVIELPFNPPGRPGSIEGRDEFLAIVASGQSTLPVRIEDCRDIVVYDTTDPGVIVVQWELAGTVVPTGLRATCPFIGVLTVRDGKIVRWREYQNLLVMAQLLGELPVPALDPAG